MFSQTFYKSKNQFFVIFNVINIPYSKKMHSFSENKYRVPLSELADVNN